MSDRYDNDTLSTINRRQGKDNGARTVLDSFIATLFVLAEPEIGVADDESRLELHPAHGFQSFNSAFR